MKIGLTINDFYKEYLQEIANLNNTTPTTICSVIVENFLNYNKDKERYPIIQKVVKMVFATKHKEIVEDQEVATRSRKELLEELEESQVQDWDTMINDLESMNPED